MAQRVGSASSAPRRTAGTPRLAWGRLGTMSRRLIVVAGTASFVALISFSRLYLGVHYLSDVLAGIAAGAFWLAVSIALQTVYGDRLVERVARRRH